MSRARTVVAGRQIDDELARITDDPTAPPDAASGRGELLQAVSRRASRTARRAPLPDESEG